MSAFPTRVRRFAAAAVPAVLVAGLLPLITRGGPADAAPAPGTASVGTVGKAPLTGVPDDLVPAARWSTTATANGTPATGKSRTRPAAQRARVKTAPGGWARLGDTGITLRTPKDATVDAQLLDQDAAAAQGADGLALRLSATEATGSVSVRIPDETLNSYYGGGYASRLHWTATPDCASGTCPGGQTPDATPVEATRDGAATTLTVAGVGGAAPVVLSAVAGPTSGDGTGTWAATSLSPASQWGGSGGSFTWSYPIAAPPAAAGPAPSIALAYDSGSVDGETASTNNQGSVVGDGWALTGTGFVERSYASCSDDGVTGSADLCWKSDNATVSFGAHSGTLIKDATGVWHLQGDDGTKVEKLTGAGNGVQGGEYWKMTDTSGTQYFFGRDSAAGSAWWVPVAGNDVGEPCHGASFDASFCPQQGWRWNLDYIVDVHGNAMRLKYATETNHYARHGLATSPDNFTPYIRSGVLAEIDYGFRDGTAATVSPEKVTFSYDTRCAATTGCDSSHPGNMPDVPWDQACATGPCQMGSPTFWTTKRLTAIQTATLVGGASTNVDLFTLTQSFTTPSDGSSGTLRLDKITRTGQVGGSVAMPPVVFTGTELQNRVTPGDGLAQFMRERITKIQLDTGGLIYVSYLASDCNGTKVPASPQTDAMRCFQQRWAPDGGAERTEYFNIYPVAQIVADPHTGGPGQAMDVTSYDYSQGKPAWRLDTSPLTPDSKRTWGVSAGFSKIVVNRGDVNQPASQESTTYTYFQGMDSDIASPAGATRSASVTASDGTSVTDSAWFAGRVLETVARSGAGGPIVADTITVPWASAATASASASERVGKNGTVFTVTATARFTGDADTRVIVPLAAGGSRVSEVKTTYDTRGRPVTVSDLGDVATAADDTCETTTYADNTAVWLLGAAAEVKLSGAACDKAQPAQLLAGTRAAFDGAGLGAVPTRGDVTRTDELAGYDASGGPVWETVSTATYDGLGRLASSTDALGRTTSTAYTPAYTAPGADVGPPTAVVSTNPLGWATTTGCQPGRGAPAYTLDQNGHRTDAVCDPLGRLTGVWLPDRQPAAAFPVPSVSHAYVVSQTTANSVATTTLNSTGSTVTSWALFDGLGRARQTQDPSEATGPAAVVSDVLYDAAGRAFHTYGPWAANQYPSGTLIVPTIWTNIANSTLTNFDGAGRVSSVVTEGFGLAKWRTGYAYGGDHVDVTPPAGGHATTAYSDARGNTTRLIDWHGAAPAGAADTTSYGWDWAGRMTSMTGPGGAEWSWEYDLLGRQAESVDPGAGTTTRTFDAAGNMLTETDARGVTLAHSYDALGRATGLYRGSTAGPQLASWAYDTLPNGGTALGQPVSATSYSGGGAYTSAATGYDALGRPTGSRVTIAGPVGAGAGQGALNGSWDTTVAYNPDGSVKTVGLPAMGGLPAEPVNYAYTAVGDLSTMKGRAIYVGGVIYDSVGQPLQLAHYDGMTYLYDQWAYDQPTGRMTESAAITSASTNDVAADRTYTYTDAGTITRITNTSSAAATDTQCFAYDWAQRLTQTWTPAGGDCAPAPTSAALGGPAPYWQSYTYNAAGDRAALTAHATGAAGADRTDTYAYPAPGAAQPDAVQSVTHTQGGAATTDSYSYDPAGNTLTRPGQALAWDDTGRLARTTTAAGVQSNIYDAAGDLLVRVEADGSATAFLGDTELSADPAGKLSATRTYTALGRPVAVRTSKTGTVAGVVTDLSADPAGTATVNLTTDTSKITVRYFDPFGNPRDSSPVAWPVAHGFLDKPLNPATGTTHLGARDYDPKLARFLSVDPLLDPTDPQSLNGYTYADNNPITKTDPTGLGVADYLGPGQAVNDHKNTDNSWIKHPATASGGGAPPAAGAGPIPGWTQDQYDTYAGAWASGSFPLGAPPPGSCASYEQCMHRTGEILRANAAPGSPYQILIQVGDCPMCDTLWRWGSNAVKLVGDITGITGCFIDHNGLECAALLPVGKIVKGGKLVDDAVRASRGAKNTKNAAKAAGALVDSGKYDYLFGKVASSSHNAARSAQNAQQLARIGVYDNATGRALLQSHFDDVVAKGDNIVRSYTDAHGTFQVRDSLFFGPGGSLKFESTWQVTDSGLRLTTVIPMGGP